jgi:hypothetical protein
MSQDRKDPSEYTPDEYVYNEQYFQTANTEKLAILERQIIEEKKRRTPAPDPTQMTDAQYRQWQQQEIRKGEHRKAQEKARG